MDQNEEYMTLLRSMLQGKGLKYVIDLCSDVIENPVMLHFMEAGGWYIYSSKYPLNAPDIQRILDTGVSSQEADLAHQKARTGERVMTERIFLLEEGYFADYPRIIRSICKNRKSIATLCILTGNRSFQTADFAIADVFGQVIEEKLYESDAYQTAMYEYLLQDILQGKALSDTVNQKNWKAAIGWFRGSKFYMCLIRGDKGIRNQDELLFRRKLLANPEIKITMFDGDLVIFINVESHSRLRDLLNQMERVLTETDYRCIISGQISQLSEMRNQYTLLCHAWDTAKMICPEEQIVYESTLATYTLLNWADSQGDISVLCSSKLSRLLAYDEEYGTNYFETLSNFLTAGRRKDVAQIMNLRKNTLNYRLQKIEEIIDADIDDGETRFSLHMGLYIHRYLASKD